MVTMTPMGIDPPTCGACGEWEGSSGELTSSVERHGKCVQAMRRIQERILMYGTFTNQADILKILDETIGPIDLEDIRREK